MSRQELYYSAEHTWAKLEGDLALVGITDYAQKELGNVVFVELPEEGRQIKQGEPFGVIESVKAVSDLHAPLSGEVVGINQQLEDTPEAINEDPYGKGWIARVKLADAGELDNLLSGERYEKLIAQKE